MIGGLHCIGPATRQNIMMAGACGIGCMPYGAQEAERHREHPAPTYTLQRLTPVTHFLSPEPTLHSSTTSQKSIRILNPSMAQTTD
jgi:hypothetical protein